MNLAGIKTHPDFPFFGFRQDDLQFLMLELYWAELLRLQFTHSNGGADQAAKWQVRYPADRDDGNPILSVINRSLDPPRALRVIQNFNSDGLPQLDLEVWAPVTFRGDAYVPFVPDLTQKAIDDDGESRIEELVIFSEISAQCERWFAEIVTSWCIEQVSEAHMRQTLDAYWVRVRQCLIQVE